MACASINEIRLFLTHNEYVLLFEPFKYSFNHVSSYRLMKRSTYYTSIHFGALKRSTFWKAPKADVNMHGLFLGSTKLIEAKGRETTKSVGCVWYNLLNIELNTQQKAWCYGMMMLLSLIATPHTMTMSSCDTS